MKRKREQLIQKDIKDDSSSSDESSENKPTITVSPFITPDEDAEDVDANKANRLVDEFIKEHEILMKMKNFRDHGAKNIVNSDSDDDDTDMDRKMSENSDNDDDDDGDDDNDSEIQRKVNPPAVKKQRFEKKANDDDDDYQDENKISSTTSDPEELRKIMLQQMGLVEEEKDQRKFTQQEIRTLKETENLFSSSLFRLAFTEILREVGIDWDKNKSIEIALHVLKSKLESMPQKNYIVRDLFETYLSKHQFQDLFQLLDSKVNDKNWSIQMTYPTRVGLVGSFLLRSVAKPDENVDVGLLLPPNLLKNNSNEGHDIYFLKRAAYVCALGDYLKQFDLFNDFSIERFRDDSLKPILVIKPRKDKKLAQKFVKTKFKIKILPMLPSDYLGENDNHKIPIFQRHGLIEDMYFFKHLELMHTHFKDTPSLVESITLYKVWLKQRGLDMMKDSVNGFLFSIIIIYLLMKRNINKHMSPFQILKFAMFWLANTKMNDHFVLTSNSSSDELLSKDINALKSAFPIVLLDSDLKQPYNIFHRVSESSWKEIQHEARLSLKYFEDNQRTEAMEALFLTKHNFWQKFDVYLRIKNLDNLNGGDVQKKLKDFQVHGLCYLKALKKKILNIVQQSLSDRLRIISMIPGENDNSIIVGLLFEKDWSNPLIKGPSPLEEEKKKEFDTFWAEKSKQRKFKDGSIAMCAYFPHDEEHSVFIIEDICQYVLSKHLQIEKSNVGVIGKEIHNYLFIPKSQELELQKSLEEAFSNLKSAILSTPIHLVPNSVEPGSPDLMSTAIYPTTINLNIDNAPKPASKSMIHSSRWCTDPIKVIIEFQTNMKWPDGIDAIEKLNQLIFIKYSKELPFTSVPYKRWMDIYYSGFVFRLVARIEKQFQIWKTSGKALDPQVLHLEKVLYQVPTHILWMNTMRSIHPSLTSTTKLAKRWVHAHLFSDHIDDELIELLCVYLFTMPYPYETPNTDVTGFSRFIHLIANYPWNQKPLFVNFCNAQDDSDEKQRIEIEKEFELIENEYEIMNEKPPMYVVASYNKQFKNYWTKHKPSKMILNRLVRIAKETENILSQYFVVDNQTKIDWKSIFRTSINNFDFVIYIKQSMIQHPERLVDHPSKLNGRGYDQVLKNLLKDNDRHEWKKQKVIVGFNPVDDFVQQLRQRFGDYMLIFRDACANDRIGVVWNPSTFLLHSFSIGQTKAMMPILSQNNETQSCKLVTNIFEIMSDIEKMGRDLIDFVDLRNGGGNKIINRP